MGEKEKTKGVKNRKGQWQGQWRHPRTPLSLGLATTVARSGTRLMSVGVQKEKEKVELVLGKVLGSHKDG